MSKLNHLFENNRSWAEGIVARDPEFFTRLAEQQTPEYLWIGCSDSRVPANEIVGMQPGELFVHRNVANVVVHTDLNCLSVMQFAIDVLQVKHVIVCGHYGCGGVRAAYRNDRVGLTDNWLHHVKDVRDKHQADLAKIDTEDSACRRLCELNVIEQVTNVCETTVIRDAWLRDQDLSVHGWIYGLEDGRLRDLEVTTAQLDELEPSYRSALEKLGLAG